MVFEIKIMDYVIILDKFFCVCVIKYNLYIINFFYVLFILNIYLIRGKDGELYIICLIFYI